MKMPETDDAGPRIRASKRRGISMKTGNNRKIIDKEYFQGEIKFDEPLSSHTSLGIGGPADIMIFPENVLSLKHVMVTATREKIPVFVIGAGTNLLIKDGGVRGIVISTKFLRKVEIIRNLESLALRGIPGNELDRSVALYVESGKPLGGLIDFTGKSGFSGIEALVGIPGTFGGALFMNAGSFGSEIQDVVLSAAVMDVNGDITILEKGDLRFSYRTAHFPHNAVILSGNILLTRESPGTVQGRIRDFLEKKRGKQPIQEASAGCVFRNPEGEIAGKLVEEAGCKGMAVGGIEVSTVHANYFINRGGATAGDFLELMETVRKKVKESCGIVLEPEIKIIGSSG